MRAFCRHITIVSICVVFLFMTAVLGGVSPSQSRPGGQEMTLQGNIKSGENGLSGYHVSLYGAFIDHGTPWVLLGSAETDGGGHFSISYSISPDLLTDDQPLLFVEAVKDQSMLASCIGPALSAPNSIIVNERTTVATANAFAQFIGAQSVEGNFYGMKNAAQMLKNFADPALGTAGIVVSSIPNGSHTSTYATFNSLANVVTACVSAAPSCAALFTATTPPGQPAPANVLQAMANLVKYPSYPGYPNGNQDPIFVLSQVDPIYAPSLPYRPTSWLLFLKITGGFYDEQNADNLMSGPANFAIDKEGFVWFDTNYIPQPPDHYSCASDRAVKMTPSGQPVANAPFIGGGLSGQGWGAIIDTNDNTWIANFGFQDPPCEFLPQNAPHNSVSEFASDGTAISPPQGYTDGKLSWPMGLAPDRSGNIWIANCGNDTVTRYAGGDHTHPLSIALGSAVSPGNPQVKPFGLATDLAGNVWVTDNRASTVTIISPDGRVLKTIPSVYQGTTIITHPIGNAADSHGNIWVANSDWLDAPCPTRRSLGTADHPSATLLMADTQQPNPGSPFSGGGITLPWGVAVDGNDTVWVFNFGVTPPRPKGYPTAPVPPNGIARLCGADTSKCPVPGMHTGDPISPSTGYRSDAFMRITAGQIDPSGNIWIADNWKIDVNPFKNPGGNAIVIAVGAAGPIKTPLIGPPVPFGSVPQSVDLLKR